MISNNFRTALQIKSHHFASTKTCFGSGNLWFMSTASALNLIWHCSHLGSKYADAFSDNWRDTHTCESAPTENNLQLLYRRLCKLIMIYCSIIWWSLTRPRCSALNLVSPRHRLELVEELGLHHGDLVDDEVSTASPVLQHPGPLGQLDALLQRGRAGANTWKERGYRGWKDRRSDRTQMNNTHAQSTPSTVYWDLIKNMWKDIRHHLLCYIKDS